MKSFTITLPGCPQPKERARRGAGGRWYTPERTRRYEKSIGELAQVYVPRDWPADAKYSVEVVAHFPDARARDLDNVAKSVLDACNKVLWRDDSQVSRVALQREIDRVNPRTVVTFRVLEAA